MNPFLALSQTRQMNPFLALSEWAEEKCALRAFLLVNSLPHMLQVKEVPAPSPPLCCPMCACRLFLVLNLEGQWAHWYVTAFGCSLLTWVARSCLCGKSNPQSAHLKDTDSKRGSWGCMRWKCRRRACLLGEM